MKKDYVNLLCVRRSEKNSYRILILLTKDIYGCVATAPYFYFDTTSDTLWLWLGLRLSLQQNQPLSKCKN